MLSIYLIYLLFFFYPFINWQIKWQELNVPFVDIIALLLLPVLLIRIFRKKFNWRTDFPGLLFYVAWLAIAAWSLINVPFEFSYSLKYFFRPLGFFYLMYVIVPWQVIRQPKILLRLFYIIYGLGLFSALLGLVGYLTSTEISLLSRRAVPWDFFGLYPLGSNHNQVAEILIVAIPIAYIILNLVQSTIKKKLVFLSILFMILITLLTFSRSGWLALGLEFILFVVMQYRHNLKQIVKYLLAIFTLLLPLIIYMLVFSQQSFVSTSTENRAMVAEMAYQVFRDHPIIGQGPATLNQIISRDFFYIVEYGEYVDAHGFLQQVGAEQGILGLLTFLSLIGYLFYQLFKVLNKKYDFYWQIIIKSCFIYSCGLLLFEAFQTSYYNAKMWLPFGLALMAALLSQKYGQKSPAHN